MVEDGLEPAHPIAVAFPASSEAIDALFGTKLGSPRVVPDETKLAIANCASRGSTRSKTFGAVWHCRLLLVLSSLFVDHPIFTVALHWPVRFSNACNLRRSRSTAQLHVGNRPASKGVTETIRRSMALESRPLLDARLRLLGGVDDRAPIVQKRPDLQFASGKCQPIHGSRRATRLRNAAFDIAGLSAHSNRQHSSPVRHVGGSLRLRVLATCIDGNALAGLRLACTGRRRASIGRASGFGFGRGSTRA